MDLVVNVVEHYVLHDYLYRPWAKALAQQANPWVTPTLMLSPTWMPRQALSIFLSLSVLGFLLYAAVASASYLLFFVVLKSKYHPAKSPQPFKGQVLREITLALWSIPVMGVLTTPIVLLEFMGYAKVYDHVDEYGWGYLATSVVLFLVFTDTSIYWIHRWEHEIPLLYRYVHKPHHEWIVPTSYAALAFHPVDGWLQSMPYHIFVFIFPLHKIAYLMLFAFVQVWTISIHDGVDFAPFSFINGAAHHTHHHSKFKYNYGQFFTFWDTVGGTYLAPADGNKADEERVVRKGKKAA